MAMQLLDSGYFCSGSNLPRDRTTFKSLLKAQHLKKKEKIKQKLREVLNVSVTVYWMTLVKALV